MARTTLVDGEEGEFGSSVDADLDPMLDTQETLAEAAEALARPSQKALYVPSPLPMGELKKALARDAEDEATAAPTLPPPSREDAALLSMETPLAALHPAAPHAPPPGLERKIDRRFESVVDSEEARAIGARVNARANAIAAAKGIKAHPQPLPLPSLDEFAPIVMAAPVPPAIAATGAAKDAPPPKKTGRFATAMLFLLALLLGGAAIAAALGKLTKDNAYRALTTARSAVIHVAQAAQRL